MATDSKSKRLPWRKHYCGDFLGRSGRWPYEAIGCYTVLLDLIYLNGPMSETELEANLIPVSEGSRSLIRSVLQQTERGWTHHRIEEDREHSAHVSRVRRDARLGLSSDNCATIVEQMTNKRAHPVHKTADASASVNDSVSALASESETACAFKIDWTAEGGFSGITAADRDGWTLAYPAVNIDRQLAAMTEWLKSNPLKARKSNWRRFVTTWLSKQQDRGGDVPTVGRKGVRDFAAEAAADLASIQPARRAGRAETDQIGPRHTTTNGTQQRAS